MVTKTDKGYTIKRDDGSTVELTMLEVSLLVNQVGRDGLRAQISDRVDNAIEDNGLNLEKYNGTREEFEDEIFEEFEDEIDYGNSVSDDDIDEAICDLGSSYDMFDDGDDEEDE